MQVMKERDDGWKLSDKVQIDDAYYGGERHVEKKGVVRRIKSPLLRLYLPMRKAIPFI